MVCYVRTAAEGHRLRSLVLAETNQRTRRAAVLETVGAFAILATPLRILSLIHSRQRPER